MDLKYYNDCSEYEAYLIDVEIERVKRAAVQKYGVAQKFKAIEEMAELTQAIIKYHCEPIINEKKCNEIIDKQLKNLQEEIVDVQIMLDQLKIMYGYDKNVEIQKIEKLRELIGEYQTYEYEGEL